MVETTTPLVTVLLLLSDLFAFGLVVWLVRKVGHLRRERNELLQQKDVVFNFVYDVSEVFAESDTVDMTGLLKRVLSYALRTTRGGAGALYMVEDDRMTLSAGAVAGVFPPLAGGLDAGYETAFSKVRHVEKLVRAQKVHSGSGLIGQVFARGVPLMIQDAEIDSRVPSFEPDFLHVHSILLVPLRFRQEVLGVIVVVNRIDGNPFNAFDVDLLQALIDQAAVSLHYARMSVAIDEKRRMDRDLAVAREIQAALLPDKLPAIPGLKVATFSAPARQIGGDYYDVIQVDEDHLGLVVADVSGKSISGAIVMSMCRSLLRVTARECRSPTETLRRLNAILGKDIGDDMFVSMVYAVVNVHTGCVSLARAGHVYPVLATGSGSCVRLLESDGIALGLADSEIFDPVLEEFTVTMRPQDMLVLYTDGITEAQTAAGQEWGVMNLVQIVEKVCQDGRGVQDLTTAVQEKLLAFVGDMTQYDDMTLLAVMMGSGDQHNDKGAE